MKSSNKILKIDSILEYYDNPQLLTARDAFDTLYLCLLYDDFPACKYTEIRISSHKLNELFAGDIDLRSLFVNPENENESKIHLDLCSLEIYTRDEVEDTNDESSEYTSNQPE